MITFITPFELQLDTLYEAEKNKGVLIASLKHNWLPIEFSCSIDLIDGSKLSLGIIQLTISQLYKLLELASVEYKSTLPIQQWHHLKYFPEYDKENDCWFVIDSLGNRCYTEEEINLEKNRLLKV